MSLDKLVHPMTGNNQDHTSSLHLPPVLDGQLKLGDRVTIFNEKEEQLVGTVRWLGGGFKLPKPSVAVGIETVSDMYNIVLVLYYYSSLMLLTLLNVQQSLCTCVAYHIVENIGGRKHGQIWRIDRQSFFPQIILSLSFKSYGELNLPKFCTPSNLKS